MALPPSQSLHTWHVTLAPSAADAPFYHPGRFALLLALPADYPFRPPTLRFATRIYHPNVTDDAQGSVCLALLKPDQWKPSTRLRAVLDAVAALLAAPLPDDPLEERIADEYRNDRAAFERNARQHVERYAMAEPVFPAGP